MTWIIGIIALAVGGALGAIFTKATQKDVEAQNQKIDDLEQKLGEAQQTTDLFQDRVSEHFVKTSELFEDMTQKYRDIYDQLSADAQQLCKPGTEATLLNSTIEVQVRTVETLADESQQADVAKEIVEEVSVTEEVSAAEEVKEANATEEAPAEVEAAKPDDELTPEKTEVESSTVEATSSVVAVADEPARDPVQSEESNVPVEKLSEQPNKDGDRPSIH